MPMTTFAKHAMLDALPDTVYVAFFSGGGPGVGTEVVPATLWGAGNRPAMTLAAASGGTRKPAADTGLGTVDAASTAVTDIAYYDAATAGNLLGSDPYARTFVATDVVQLLDTQDIFTTADPA